MSMHAPAGKAVNLGHKPGAWATFCAELGACLATPEQRWAAYVMVAIHDVGKSDAFRAQARGVAGWKGCVCGVWRGRAGAARAACSVRRGRGARARTPTDAQQEKTAPADAAAAPRGARR
jgi:hypothetical protein